MMFTDNGRTADQQVVIAGAGRVGYRTAQVLDDYGHEVYVIERDSETVEQVTDRRTGIVIEGDATDPQILRQTKPEEADIIAALTGDAADYTLTAFDFVLCGHIHAYGCRAYKTM